MILATARSDIVGPVEGETTICANVLGLSSKSSVIGSAFITIEPRGDFIQCKGGVDGYHPIIAPKYISYHGTKMCFINFSQTYTKRIY